MVNLRNTDLVVVDVETSGVNPFRNDVLAIAFVPLAKDKEPLEVYVDAESIVWAEQAMKIFRNYEPQWEKNKVPPSTACDLLECYLATTFDGRPVTPLGQNIGFDVAFLRKLAYLGGREQLRGLSHRAVDTHTMLYVLSLQGRLPKSALSSDGAFQHFGIEVHKGSRHTALGDALATRELALRLFELLQATTTVV